MDRLDEEMRETIRRLWSVQGRKMLDLLMPSVDGQYFTVLHSRRRTSLILSSLLSRGAALAVLFASASTIPTLFVRVNTHIIKWDSMSVEGLANAGTLLVAFTVILSACGRSKVWLMQVLC